MNVFPIMHFMLVILCSWLSVPYPDKFFRGVLDVAPTVPARPSRLKKCQGEKQSEEVEVTA